MKWRRTMLRTAAVAATVMGLWCTQASAAVMILTIEGAASPTSGYAPFAAYFPQFAAGQQPAPYTLQYTYDTALGASGGSAEGMPSPISEARLRILDGLYILDTFSLATIGQAGGSANFIGALPGGSSVQSSIVGGFPAGLATAFSMTCALGCGTGSFQLPFSGTLSLSVNAAQAVVVPTPVPEPSVWAMLIAGFGLVGAALRRRRLAAIPA